MECLCQIKNPSARQTMSIELQADNSEVFAELKKILPKSLGRNVAAVIVSEFAAVLCSKLMTVPRIGESHLVPLMGIKRAPPRAQRPAPVEAKPVPSSCEARWEGRSSETFCMAWPSFHCKWVSIRIVYLARFPTASGICFFSIFGLCVFESLHAICKCWTQGHKESWAV